MCPDLTQRLRRRARLEPDRRAYVFLADGEEEQGSLTWGELDVRARAIAAALGQRCAPGDRALLLYPPGLDFVAAFFGCLYAGVVAVPAYPPRSARTLPRLRSILEDSQPAVALAPSASATRIRSWLGRHPDLPFPPWLATDELPPELAEAWREPVLRGDDLAFLQYTSGSTSAPKGVMVSRANLDHNQEVIRQACDHTAESVFVTWLPLYHDLGLIGNLLQATWVGALCVLMAPVAFLQSPARWLRAVSRYRGTTSGGPNFAYDLCARKVPEAEREGLDLSSWRVAFNGAEPVRAETLERFAQAFAPAGFRRGALYPCYGLAEATLMVSGNRPGEEPAVRGFSAAALGEGRVEADGSGRELVGCGRVLPDLEVVIADPEAASPCPPGRVGEVWVAGGSVARGYWNRPEESERAFGARLADGRGPFLRTGDLGFLEGEQLFLAGRIKDLVILRGRNHYPQDLELTAERSHPALRPGGGAAFAVESEGEERLVIVQEVERHTADPGEIAATVRSAVAAEHEALVHEVVLVQPGGVPKTTSGKVQRRACRELYLSGALPAVGRSALAAATVDEPAAASILAPGALREALPATPEPDREALLEGWLRQTFARLARIDPSAVDPEHPLTRSGLDSLAAIELKNAVEAELGSELSIAALLEGLTLREAARLLVGGAAVPDPPGCPEEGTRDRARTERICLSPQGELEHRPQPDPASPPAHPLSWNQRSLWFLYRLAPESTAYHIAGAARLPGGADPGRLRRALQALVDRHAILRTTYGEGPEGPVQRIAVRQEVAFLCEDGSPWSEEELRRRLHEEAFRPFDLERGPVFRAALFARGPEAWLVLTVHHIAADLWSLAVLARELGISYGEGADRLPEADASYLDFVLWQERMLAGPRGERLQEHWLRKLAGAPPLDLPTDRPRPPVQSFRGVTRPLRLEPALLEAVSALAREHGCTLFVALLAGFQALLARWSGQEGFLVGSPTSGRGSVRWSGVAGYFVDLVALRADLAGGPTTGELLARARREALDAFEHQDFPFALLAERLQPERQPGRPPLVQAVLSLEKAPAPELAGLAAFALGEPGARLSLNGLELESAALPSPGAQRDLTLLAAELGGRLALSLQADADLFDAATAERLLGHLANLLRAMAAGPDRRVAELEMLSEPERRQLVEDWSGTSPAFPREEPIHRLFEETARDAPQRTALVWQDLELTYAELNARADRLARRLRSLGVAPEIPVGVALERSPEMIVSYLGVLKAGGAYVPLDPGYPRERLAALMDEVPLPLVLTAERLLERLPPGAGRVVCLDGLDAGAEDPLNVPLNTPLDIPLDIPVPANSLAYVMFTSGSTGRPKAVGVEHRSVVRLVRGADWADLGPEQVFLQLAPASFDAATLEVWGPLLNGGRLALFPGGAPSLAELGNALARHGVTTLWLTAGLFHQVVEDRAEALRGLSQLLAGGDVLSPAHVERALAALPGCRLINGYGPTENTTFTCCHTIREPVGAAVPIGRPVANTRVYVLDGGLQPAPAGVPGELFAGGDGLARGYLNRPDLTAERFVPSPFAEAPGARLYRTGDRVRWRPDGAIEFLGRLDQQVKIRGFRVEPGEVEAALARHPAVRQAAVAVVGRSAADKRLVAWVEPREGAAGPGLPNLEAALRAFLRERLPEPMVPSAFVVLPELPLSPNGKVDRRALAAMPALPQGGGSEGLPRTPTEELLAGLWADLLGVLGVDRVGIHDSFFDLGGHSLLATRLAARLREPFGVDLPLRDFFADPTVAGLAVRIEAARGTGSGAPPLRRREPGAADPLSFAQERLWFLDRLAPGSAVYNVPVALRLRGTLSVPALEAALAEIARRQESLRTVFPTVDDGPVQAVLPAGPFPLEWADVAERDDPEAAALGLAAEEARRPFDLREGPLARALLVRTGPADHLLLLALHHIVADGWSLRVLLRELEAEYPAALAGRGSGLSEPAVRYADFAAWERELLSGERLAAQLAWWRETLAGAPEVLELPTDRPRPPVRASRGTIVPVSLPADLTAVLETLARREGATLFMVLLAGFTALLHRYTGQEDLVVGSPVARRDRPETEGLIGFFVNTLPLRARLDGDPSGRELLRRARESALGAYDHQHVPVERLVEELQPRRDLSRTPLFQVLLAVEDSLREPPRLPGIEAGLVPVHTGTAKFDLILSLARPGEGAGLAGEIEIDTDLFDASTAERLAAHLGQALRALAAEPEGRVSELPLLGGPERREVAAARHGREEAAPDRAGEGGAPRTPLEELIAGLWADLLDRETVGAHESFFELGGHSLLATRLLSRLRRTLGVELPVAAVFESPTVAGLAAAVERARRSGAAAEAPPLVPLPRDSWLPLSFAQERLWLLEQIAGESPAYNVPLAVRLRGELAPAVPILGAALAGVARRHETLRTTFAVVDGRPVQVIAPVSGWPLPLVDLGGLAAGTREAEAGRLAGEEARRPFDLAAGPLARAALLRLGADEALLVLDLHHIVTDGWSVGVLLREISALSGAFAAGRPSPLSEPPVQYADFAVWQRRWLSGGALAAQLAFWREQLAGAPPALGVPADRPRPAAVSYRGGAEPVELPAELVRDLRALARREGATLFMVLLGGLAALLHRYTGEEDLVVGTPVANRRRPEVEPLIGFFANTLPLRARLDGNPAFSVLLGRLRAMTLAAWEHQDVPFERLVEELAVERDLSRSPLFQVMLAVQDGPGEELRLPGLGTAPVPLHNGTAKFDLLLALSAGAEAGLTGGLEYSSDLFEPATVRRMVGHLGTLLAGLAGTGPEVRVGDLPLLDAAEARQVLVAWNDTAAPWPQGVGLYELFAAQAARTPEAVALVWRQERLTYGELAARAGRLARRLRGLGVGPEVLVGVLSGRTPDMVAGMLAALRAGGAYLPLDPAYPAERLAFLLADSAAPVVLAESVLAESRLAPALPAAWRGAVVLLGRAEEGEAGGDVPPPAPCHPEQTAYAIYTSGSTGTPKGVAIRQGSAVARVAWGAGAFGPERLRGVLAATSICFDLSVFEIFVPLAAGGTVILADDALALPDLPAASEVTLINTVPSAMAALARSGRLPASVRTVNLAGEPLRRELASRAYALPGVEEVWNLYGPSEDTTYSTGVLVPREGGEPTIGRPLPNDRAYVLDARQAPAPLGVPGELWLGGAGLARGYLGRPHLTADRFRPDPFGGEPGARLYRTGDLARWRPDGELELLGRLDHQVKVRGFRIELGEVEATLARHPGVAEAVAVVRGEGEAARLAAYVETGAAGPGQTDPPAPEELRAWLAERLPAHMVPGVWVLLEALPRTPNGKVDRKALPEPEASPGQRDFVPPRTPAEALLAGLWADLLGIERIGVHDDFFALGGHSLLAARAVSRLRERLGVELGLRAVFEAPTVAGLAARVEEARRAGLVPLPPLPSLPPGAEAPLSLAQERLWFLDRMSPGTAVYNVPTALRLRGPLDREAWSAALAEIARRHEPLRTVFATAGERPVQVVLPPGPFPLAAADFGDEEEALREAEEEARRPFDLARGPLARGLLLRLAADDHLFVLTLHHTVADGWSLDLLFRELEALYAAFAAGLPSPLPEPPARFAEWAAWQRERLAGGALDEQLAWWRQRLAGAPEALALPTDRPRPATQGHRGLAEPVELPAELARALQALARREGATLFVTLLAGWAALLSRYTRQDDLVVGSVMAGRGRTEVEGLIGFFVNTLPLRADLSGEPSFHELIGRLREMALGAQEHQEVPFERLVQELLPRRDPSRAPLFQASFVFQESPATAPRLPGLAAEPVPLHTGTAKLDLALGLVESEGRIFGSAEADADLFDGPTVGRMLAHLVHLLAGAAADPERRVSELPVLSATERREILELGTGRAVPPFEATLHELFAAQAARTGAAVALEFEDATLTYAEVEARSNRLARHLRRRGAGPDAVAGLYVPRSPEMAVALLGILKAGAAYLPLDTGFPAERLAAMVEDARPVVLVTVEALRGELPPGSPAAVFLDGADREALERESPEPLPVLAMADNLAFVMYTSGSTGRPKGVAVPHRGLVNRVLRAQEVYGLTAGDAVLQKAPLAFDFSLWELLAPMTAGGRVVLARPGGHLDFAYLAGLIERRGITLFHFVPSMMEAFLAQEGLAGRAPHVRQVFVGGEALSPALRDRILGTFGVPLENQYGPTEASIDVVWRTFRPGEPPGPAPIGRPIAGSSVHVLTPSLEPAPPNVPGEIWIGGAPLARGYLGRPDLTAERFVPDPFASCVNGGRLYRTGDLARRLPDGEIEYLGRADQQVKVHGVRIEPAEIEAALLRHPQVREAAVILQDGREGKRLAAFFVAGAPIPAPRELRRLLSQALPDSMVPSVFAALPELPRTGTGKLDRRALARFEPPEAAGAAEAFVAPRTPAEELVAGILEEVLGVERIGAHDDFFALGGHSLLAVRVVARLREPFGVELPLRAVFEAPTAAGLAGRIEEARRAGLSALPPVVPVPRTAEAPLSLAQERLWFLDRLSPGLPVYNIPAGLRLQGALDPALPARVLGEIVRRHEALRTVFAAPGDQPVQILLPCSPFRLPLADLSACPEPEREALRQAAEEARRPFDLERGPLARALLLRLAPEDHLLVLTLHHIVSDGWSTGVLLRELEALWPAFAEGRPSPLPELPVQYADWAVWQREQLAGGVLEGQLAWWRRRLAGAPDALDLPTDRPRPAARSHRGLTEPLDLAADRTRRLRALARREGATLFLTLLAGWTALLSRYSRHEDLVVGSVVAGRGRAEVEGLIGFFVNTLPLRADLAGEPSFRELLARLRETALGSQEHQDVPFERMVQELLPRRDPSRPPLFQVGFAFQQDPAWAPRLPGLAAEPVALGTGTAKLELSLALAEVEGGVHGVAELDADLFDAVTVRRMLDHLLHLLEEAAADPGRRVSELPILSPAESREILELGTGRAVPPSEATLHELFAAQAARTGAAVALEFEGATVTYAEVEARSNRLARLLRRRGAGPDAVVGLYVPRSPEMAVALLGILKAGAAYLPLDIGFPAERLAAMVEDARPVLLVTVEALRGELPPGSPAAVFLDGADREALERESPQALSPTGTPDNLAFVMYTSGSTGRPKGVAVPHRGLVNRFLRAQEVYCLTDGEVILHKAPLAFDFSLWELLAAMTVGGRVVLARPGGHLDFEYLTGLIERRGITIFHFVPSMMEAFLAQEGLAGRAPHARQVYIGGEALSPALRDRFLDTFGIPLDNQYGPTEASIDVAWRTYRPGEAPVAAAPIGRPIAGSSVHVLTPSFEPAPPNVPGEIWIGGVPLARGYLGRPDLTAERFAPDPFSDGGRLYRTGDLARRLPDGEIEYLGRADQQVKIHGVRIEPAEIEAALLRHPRVREAAVVLQDGPAGKRLVACFVAGAPIPAPRELRRFLSQALPDAMVPAVFAALPELPRMGTGKLDRRALARLEPPEAAFAAESFVAPRTPAEELVAAVWREVLGNARVGAHDDFFALGGHSLLATRVVSRLRGPFGVELPLREVFERPTVAALARRLEELRRGADGTSGGPPPLRPVPRGGDLPLSFAQERLWFLHQLDPEDPAYNIAAAVRLDGELDPAALVTALERIALRHEALRTTFRSSGGHPVQVVAPRLGLALPQEDLSGRADPAGEALRLAAAEALTPFDLERGPVLRATLLRLGRAEHVLLLTVHHIAADGWSLGVFLRELAALYSEETGGGAADLPGQPVQYADYAVWQRGWLAGEALATRLAWWRDALAGLPDLDLPSDRPRALATGHHGAGRALRLPEASWGAVEALALRESATPFLVVLAGVQALLSRYSGQTDFAVGTPVAGRDQVEIEGLIGFFVNTLVLRADLAGDPPFRELLARTREAALGAFGRQDLPFEHLVEAISPERSLGQTPLFQVMLSYGNTPMPALELPGLALTPVEPGARASKFDLSFQVAPEPAARTGPVWPEQATGGAEGAHTKERRRARPSQHRGAARIELTYRPALHDPSTAERLLAHLAALLAAAAEAPGVPLSELPVLAPAERHQLLVEWNDTPFRPAAERPFHELFEDWAARTPGALAVTGAEELTFGELDRRANRIAHRLLRLGVGPEVRVGLRLEASAGALAGVLGILKAGGAWVPMDPTYPAERLAWIQEDSGAPVVLTPEDLEADDGGPDTPPASGALLESAAYVVYTSGSTGRPKGTVVSHRSLVNFCWWVEERLLHGRCFPVVTSLSFDASIKQFLPPLLAGRAVWIPRARFSHPADLLAELATRERVILNTVPSLWRALLALVESGEGSFPGFEALMPSGEALDRDLVDRTRAAFPGLDVWNLYGPTETTSNVAHDHVGEGPIAIGHPAAGARLTVVGRALEPLPVGVPGELLIGGPGVARGYLGRPGLTAERFIPDPFAATPGARAYFSGDLVRRLPDGRIEYLGRLDHQVKIRGFRIEPGEIEAALAAHPAVDVAVVVARKDGPGSPGAGEPRLVAYVVPRPGEEAPAAGPLRAFLEERLPAFLVPSAFVLLAALPLTPTGKVDRRALPAPAAGSAAPAGDGDGLLTPSQELVAGVFSDLLGVERPGAGGHFFELGGHSLLATQAVSRLRAAFGVDLALRALFEAPTVAGLAARLEEARRAGGASPLPPVVPVPRDRALPLSFAQERLWFLDQLDPGSPAYNIPTAVELRGRLHAGALAAALSEVVRRHEALRTTFEPADGRPRQRIAPPAPVPLPVADLSALPEEARRDEAARLSSEEARRPFDLAAGPLSRAALLRLGVEEHLALVTQHHAVSDAWSRGLLVREVAALYGAFAEGRPSPLPELPVQYADFAVWQRERLQGDALAAEIAWWRERLAGAPESLDLPADRPRPAVPSSRGRQLPVAFGGGLVRSLHALSRRRGATLFMTLLAGFQALLARYSGQRDVLVGSPIAGRTRPEVEKLIGFFVNTLVLRAEMGDDPAFAALLARVRETTLGAYEHQDLPFERLVEDLRPGRGFGRTPLFQVVLALQNAPAAALELPGLTLAPRALESGTSKFDLTLVFLDPGRDEGAELCGVIEHSADLFDAATIARLAGHLAVLLAGAAERPEARLSELPLLAEAERRQLLARAAAPSDYPRDATVHALFEERARREPEAPAVEFGSERLTCGELNRRANRLAHALRRLGVGPEVPVGLALERSAEMVVAMLGILKAGGAYVPLDLSYPRERLARMAEDAGLGALVTAAAWEGPEGIPNLRLDRDGAGLAGESADDPGVPVDAEGLAYIIFTSGSTGRPKGVAVRHRGIVRLVLGTNYMDLGPGDRVPQLASSSFDAATFEVWGSLLCGACLVGVERETTLSPEELAREIGEQRLATLFLTTALFNQLAKDAPGGLRHLRSALFGGEAADPHSPREALRRAPGVRLLHVYGPTENTTFSTFYDVREVPEGATSVPIGRPISNSEAWVADRGLRLAPEGVPGELLVGGDGLARGYHGRPDLTAERFVPHPWSGRPGERLYRTGDLARWPAAGELVYLGRLDQQVKIRGLRIEPGEIEAVLAGHSGVREAVVMAREDGPVGRHLVAYVVPAGPGGLETGELRAFLRASLPEHMVPAAWVFLEALPLTPNGKLDRRSLPAPGAAQGGGEYVAPRNALEEILAEIWMEVLGVERVGVHDDFFELGGHSLLAVRLTSQVREVLGIRIPVRTLFDAPTLGELAERLADEMTRQAGDEVLEQVFAE